MSKHHIVHGAVTVESVVPLPEQAGHLSDQEVAHIPRTPRGIGLACADAADALEKAGDRILLPHDLTPAALREAGERAEAIDRVVADIQATLKTFQQGNLLLDAHAYDLLRRLNDQLKVELPRNPELAGYFQATLKFFAQRTHASHKSPADPSSAAE